MSVDRLDEIEERACVDMANRLQAAELSVPGHGGPVKMTFVGPDGQVAGDKPVLVLLHGFDSSCLEFRRLFPLLEADFEVYALDVLGWGFTDSRGQDCGPKYKSGVGVKFLDKVVGGGRQVTLLGASLGGAIAIDLAAGRPDLVSKLVLVDAQGFQDGIGALQYLPEFLTKFFLEVLRSVPLRNAANKMSYFEKDKFATKDALNIGRLHTFKNDWVSGNLSFIKSGGLAVSSLIPRISQQTLVVWGDNDEILPKEDKFKFVDAIPKSALRIIPECGHVPHLEKPQELAFYVRELHDL